MIRYLLKSQNANSRKLYEEVFSEDSGSFVDYYYRVKAKDNKIMIQSADGGIVSMLHRNPYRLLIDGRSEEIDYIVAVATKENFRKQGRMRQVLSKALNDMYQEGKSFTYLMPAAEKIYTPYGFTFIYKQKQTRYVTIAQNKIADTEIHEVQTNQDIEQLVWYSDYVLRSKYRVYAARTVDYYKDLMEELKSDNGRIELFIHQNQVTGYCYVIEQNELEVKELHCEPSYMDTFLELIGNKYNRKEMKLTAVDDSVSVQESIPIIMARILSVEKFFEYIRYITIKIDISFCIQLSDPVITENNRTFQFEIINGKGHAFQTDAKPDFYLDISELTSWLFGYQSFEEIIRNKKASVEGTLIKNLSAITTLSDVYINEMV